MEISIDVVGENYIKITQYQPSESPVGANENELTNFQRPLMMKYFLQSAQNLHRMKAIALNFPLIYYTL